jgi:hypothetical protein
MLGTIEYTTQIERYQKADVRHIAKGVKHTRRAHTLERTDISEGGEEIYRREGTHITGGELNT